MEEQASCRRSVAELAGRFKGTAPQDDATGQESEKPVRRRPPRSLQLPKTQGDDQEPPSITSPPESKVKRNSALIEKLQANLVLSPGALMPSPKSPGFRMFPPAFPLPSPGSASVTTVTTPSTPAPISPLPTSPLTEEESPASFEDPPVVSEGSTLSSATIKGRARHSIRRRPPSRRHRQSSSGEDVSNDSEGGGVCLHSKKEKEGGGGEDQQDGKADEEEDKTEGSTSHTESKTHQEERAELKHSSREEEEEKEEKEEIKNGSPEGEEEDRSSETKVEEEKEDIERQDDVMEKATNSNSDEVDRMKSEEETSQLSDR